VADRRRRLHVCKRHTQLFSHQHGHGRARTRQTGRSTSRSRSRSPGCSTRCSRPSRCSSRRPPTRMRSPAAPTSRTPPRCERHTRAYVVFCRPSVRPSVLHLLSLSPTLFSPFPTPQQASVLSKAVTEFFQLSVNLRSAVAADKDAPGGMNGKVLEFLSKGDDATVALAERVQAGDSQAIREMQQAFMNEAYPSIGNLEALMDDDFVRSARKQLLNDEVRVLVCLRACVPACVYLSVLGGSRPALGRMDRSTSCSLACLLVCLLLAWPVGPLTPTTYPHYTTPHRTAPHRTATTGPAGAHEQRGEHAGPAPGRGAPVQEQPHLQERALSSALRLVGCCVRAGLGLLGWGASSLEACLVGWLVDLG
jgi:hypothetical protein